MDKEVCGCCGRHSAESGHMCSPKKNVPVYECQGCGILSTNKEWLCKPKLLRIL